MFTFNATSMNIMNDTLRQENMNNQLNSLVQEVVYYIKLFLFVFGTIGNILSIGIWMTAEFWRMSRSVVCIALAVTNTLYLVLAFGQSTTEWNFNGEYFLASSDLSCQIKAFVVSVSQHLDSWLILYLTLERFLSVLWPHLVKIFFDQIKAVVYVLIITLIFLTFNIFFVMNDFSMIERPNGMQKCRAEKTLWFLIRQLLHVQIPLLIIIPCNIVITIKVTAQYRKMRHCIVVTGQQIAKQRSIKVTILVLSITITYIILILPSQSFFWCCREKDVFFKFMPIFTIMPMVNASANCYLYAMSSRDYRNKIKLVIGKAVAYVLDCLPSLGVQNSVVPIELNVTDHREVTENIP